jgi:hypothetical protein
MTDKQIKSKVKELVKTLAADIEHEAIALSRTGAVDASEFDDDYRLPKILVTAAVESRKNGFRPLCTDDRKHVANLARF